VAATDYMTRAEFRARFPEFTTGLGDTALDSLLLAAQQDVKPAKFLGFTNEAHGLWTAHKAAMSPFGRPLKVVDAKGESNYSKQFDTIISQMSVKVAVL
jgi:hypothetical protein